MVHPFPFQKAVFARTPYVAFMKNIYPQQYNEVFSVIMYQLLGG